MIDIAAPVEDDGFDSGFDRFFREVLPDEGRSFAVIAVLELKLDARRTDEGFPRHIIDDLGLDVFIASIDH